MIDNSLNVNQRRALEILQKNRGQWITPGKYSAIAPWQSFRAVVRKYGGEWIHDVGNGRNKCRLEEQ